MICITYHTFRAHLKSIYDSTKIAYMKILSTAYTFFMRTKKVHKSKQIKHFMTLIYILYEMYNRQQQTTTNKYII